jgi:hypothetical protein
LPQHGKREMKSATTGMWRLAISNCISVDKRNHARQEVTSQNDSSDAKRKAAYIDKK